MVIMHWVISWLSRGSPLLSFFVKGHSTVVVKDGKVQEQGLKQTHMSRDDLDEDLREKGVAKPIDVLEARIERSGKLSVIKK
jgi:uncharacterized membrane protein YcaP (DUF421 family)